MRRVILQMGGTVKVYSPCPWFDSAKRDETRTTVYRCPCHPAEPPSRTIREFLGRFHKIVVERSQNVFVDPTDHWHTNAITETE